MKTTIHQRINIKAITETAKPVNAFRRFRNGGGSLFAKTVVQSYDYYIQHVINSLKIKR